MFWPITGVFELACTFDKQRTCYIFFDLMFLCTALIQLWRTSRSVTSWVKPLLNFSLYSGCRAKFSIKPGLIGGWSGESGWLMGFTWSNFGRKAVSPLWKLTNWRLLTFKLVGAILSRSFKHLASWTTPFASSFKCFWFLFGSKSGGSSSGLGYGKSFPNSMPNDNA